MALATVTTLATEHRRREADLAAPALPTNEVPEGAPVAPARVGAPGFISMPCVASTLSDISLRLCCTPAVASALVGDRGFVTHTRMPELTVTIYHAMGARRVTSVAHCRPTAARVADDGAFLIDVTVRDIHLDP